MTDWIKPRALIGMVHARAMPGTPHHEMSVTDIASLAAEEAASLAEAGFDAVIVENMHDRPYVHGRQSPEVVAGMTRAVAAVAEAIDLPLGVQVLSGGEQDALAIALATGASFIRCENFVYAHVADEGLLTDAAAGPLLRYRKAIGAEHVRIMCDIRKKHASHAISADLGIRDIAHTAEFCGADGVIVTGGFTGQPTDTDDVAAARGAVSLPVWVGSGVEPDQVAGLFAHADALIVGSSIKRDGLWSNPIDPARCRELAAAAREARS